MKGSSCCLYALGNALAATETGIGNFRWGPSDSEFDLTSGLIIADRQRRVCSLLQCIILPGWSIPSFVATLARYVIY